MTIDPLEAVITWIGSDTEIIALVEDRVALRHEYGSNWNASTESGITIAYDGGSPDIYTANYRGRMEFRGYAPTYDGVGAIYRRLATMLRESNRRTVETSEGTALIKYLVLESSPTYDYDSEIDVPYALMFASVMVAENEAS